MNNSQKNILVFLLKKCNQLRIQEVIKKFVDWCDEIYTYQGMLTTKTTNILLAMKM